MKPRLKYYLILMGMAYLLQGCYYDKELIFEGLPQNVSLKNDVAPILVQNCSVTGCHDATPTHAPSLVSDNMHDALVGGGYINTLDPSASLLYKEISSGNMPPSGPLGTNDQKIILAWIAEGALDN